MSKFNFWKMNVDEQGQPGSSSGASGKIHTLQPHRDLESNWAVDLAKNLEEYLLKICSGEISGHDGAHQFPVNFSEAALLLQGSVQVYSRKVEYLYSLVLLTLEFISQKSEQDQQANASAPTKDSASDAPDDPFWGLDDIPGEAKNFLDNTTSKDELLNCFVKAPANLVVLEGDCLDTTGDAGELESYLLSTSNLYRDFILLDSCDVVAVDDFLKTNKTGKELNSSCKLRKTGKELNSSCKLRKTGQYSARHSGGAGNLSSVRKGHDANLNQSPRLNNDFSANDHNGGYCPSPDHTPENNDDMYEMGGGYSEPRDSNESDDDDPWKPLNPHEPGNLKVKPYRRVKPKRRQGMGSRKHISITTEFPLARLHGTINLHLYDAWEKCATKKTDESQSLSLYEQLRQSLFNGENNDHDAFYNHEDNEDDDYDNGNHDFGSPHFDMPETAEHNEDEHLSKEKQGNDNIPFDHEGHEDPYTHSNLEDLCRSHLDSLLANLAETEHQTELAARVSTWKQRIEQNLNEQESQPPFDIHEYGEKVLCKLSLEENSGNGVSFSNIVAGQEKHDVARTFSALLQLVNNGDVDLQRDGTRESNGYTAANPFYIRLLREPKNKAKSPILKRHPRGEKNKRGKENRPGSSSPPGSNSTNRFTLKSGKGGARCTPDGKKRRKSRLLEPMDLHTAL